MGKKKSIRMKVSFPTTPLAVAQLGVDENGDVQNALTDEVMRNLPDFMPRKSGSLIASVKKVGPTVIRVDSPYARMQFSGMKMTASNGGGPFPIGDGEYRFRKGAKPKRTNEPMDYSHSGNRQAGPHWDRRMVAARGKAIVAKINRYVRSRK